MKYGRLIFAITLVVVSPTLFAMEAPTRNGCIIFLRGPSCSFKTSTCQALAALDQSCKIICEDDYCIRNTVALVEQTMPAEFKTVAHAIEDYNLFNALVRHEVLYKTAATADDKEKACSAIAQIRTYFDNPATAHREHFTTSLNNALMADIQACALAGNKVIVDSWFLRQQDIEFCKQTFKTHVVFAYAPLKILLQRLAHRNVQAHQSGNLTNKKFYDQVLNVFKKIEFTHSSSRPVIHIGSKEEIESCFETIQSQLKMGYGNRMPFTRREITQEELDKLKQEVMQKFQATSGRKKNICVNEAVCGVCDLIINTESLLPADVAKQIYGSIRLQSKHSPCVQ